MKQFFAHMSLARAIIVLSVPLCLVLGWLAWSQRAKLAEERAVWAQELPKASSEVQQLALDHTRLTQALNKDGLVRDSNPESYIRGIAAKDRVQIGDVKINARERPHTKGLVDMVYEITPTDPKREFTRTKISNFLFKLEEESRRVKVTSFTIATGQTGLKNDVVPSDDWTLKATVTSRQATRE